MKKIILVLLIALSTSVFSQEDKADIKLKETLKALKKTPYTSSLTRDYAIRASEKIITMTKDSILIKDCIVFSDSLKKAPLNDFDIKPIKKVSLSDFSKDRLKNFNIDEDKFNSTLFLKSKKYDSNVYLYIGIRYGDPYLRIVCNYYGKSWVFTKEIIFLVDGVRYDYKPMSVKRDVSSSAVVNEKIDDLIFEKSNELLNAISNSEKEIEVRFQGEKVADIKLSTKVSKQFKETIELYNEMINK